MVARRVRWRPGPEFEEFGCRRRSGDGPAHLGELWGSTGSQRFRAESTLGYLAHRCHCDVAGRPGLRRLPRRLPPGMHQPAHRELTPKGLDMAIGWTRPLLGPSPLQNLNYPKLTRTGRLLAVTVGGERNATSPDPTNDSRGWPPDSGIAVIVIHLAHSVDIARPVAEVFAFLADQSNEPRWHTDVVEVHPKGPIDLGGTSTWTIRFMGITSDYVIEVTQLESHRRIQFTTIEGRLKPTYTNIVEGVDGETRYTRKVDIPLTGMFRVVGPLMKVTGAAQKRNSRFAENLKKVLEA